MITFVLDMWRTMQRKVANNGSLRTTQFHYYSMSTTMPTMKQLVLFVMLCVIAGCAGNQDKAEGLNSKVYLRFE